jgi:hypothetical protein
VAKQEEFLANGLHPQMNAKTRNRPDGRWQISLKVSTPSRGPNGSADGWMGQGDLWLINQDFSNIEPVAGFGLFVRPGFPFGTHSI